MELFIPYGIPALLGGLILAVILKVTSRPATSVAPSPLPLTSTDMINMSSIQVAGVGGLGLVAMAMIVAWYLPAIRVSMAIALVAGVVLAVALIAWRRVH